MMDRWSAAAILLLRRRQRKKPRIWVHDINKKRKQLGEYHRLVMELALDQQRFKRCFRLDADQMEYLLTMVGPKIIKQETNFRESIQPRQRLAVTLRYSIIKFYYFMIKAFLLK